MTLHHVFKLDWIIMASPSRCRSRTRSRRDGVSQPHISKLGGYYVRLKHFSPIIHIKTLLCQIKTLLYQLKLLQFFDYYVILCHMSEINYYVNYITTIMSIFFFELIIAIISIKTGLCHLF